MSTVSESADSFTDAAGNVFISGTEVPALRAVGFVHRDPCPQYRIASVSIGKPYGCDCGGTVLMGWRGWWPLPDEPHTPGIVIDFEHADPPLTDEEWADFMKGAGFDDA